MTYNKKILSAFCVAVLVLFTVTFAVYASYVQMHNQKKRVDHTYEVISTVRDIVSNLKDVQSAQRGFVITGIEDYLTPYYMALPKIADGLEHLDVLIADNPVQIERAQELKKHVLERVSIATKIVELYRKEGQKKVFDMIREGTGKREMDQIRAIEAEMVTHEQTLLAERRTAVEAASRVTMYAGASGIFICLLILAAVFNQIRHETRRRSMTEDTLREAHDEMERNSTETQLIGRLGDYLRGCRFNEEAHDIIRNNLPMLFPGTYGSVAIFNNSRNLLHTVLTWGNFPPTVTTEFEADSCWALRQGRVHYSAGDGSVPLCDHLKKIEAGRVTVCLPMQAQGETTGQILIGSADNTPFSKHDLVTMRTVGEQISLALANLNLQRALKEQSIKDPLTKLFNRRYLEETLLRECARATRNKLPLCVLIMDIDHFKKVNDTYGHDAGDAVLVSFAQLLSKKSRKEDMACRLGGEEFVLVLPGAALEFAKIRAQEICDATRQMTVKVQNQTLKVTVSVGVSLFPDHGQSPEELIHNADLCLYKAKQNGRNQVVVYDEGLMADVSA